MKRTKKALKLKRKGLNKKLIRMLVFLVKFNLLAIPMYLIILSGFQWIPLKETTAGLAYDMLRITGINANLEDSVITVPMNDNYFIASIDWDCTGWKSMFALFALIFATGFPLRRKLAGLVLLPVLYFINIVRIWFMFYFASVYGIAYFDMVHATIWSWGLITAILILWIIWLKKDFSKLKIPTRIK
jgi:exosortase/archaeosortase family protein